jgi:hypothetical protein
MAEVSFLVRGAGAERDGRPRGESRVDACGAGARACGGPARGIQCPCTAPAGVGRSDAREFVAVLFE